MLDTRDIQQLKKIFATKEDLKKFVTKKDLLNFATKKDLAFFATKQDLREVKDEVSDLKELVQGLVVSVDGIAKVVGNLSIEYSAISNKLSRLEYR